MIGFVLTMFWLKLLVTICRIINLATGSWRNEISIGVYAADTVLNAVITIWAGFSYFYR